MLSPLPLPPTPLTDDLPQKTLLIVITVLPILLGFCIIFCGVKVAEEEEIEVAEIWIQQEAW